MADDEEEEDVLRMLCGINQASKEELKKLPGVGPAVSENLVELRPFKDWKHVSNVKGVGPVLLEILKERLFLNFPPESYYVGEYVPNKGKPSSQPGMKKGSNHILKKYDVKIVVTQVLTNGFFEVQFKDGTKANYHWTELKKDFKPLEESEEYRADQWRDFMFTQMMWGEDEAQLWEDDEEYMSEESCGLDEIGPEEIDANEESFGTDHAQISRNGRDAQVEPYQLHVLPNPKRFPHIGRVKVTIDWLRILKIPVYKHINGRMFEYEYAWIGMPGEIRTGTGALVNGSPGLYQWVMTSAHLVFPAMKLKYLESTIKELQMNEKKVREELATEPAEGRIYLSKSCLVEAYKDIIERLKDFRRGLKNVAGEYFKIDDCPMKVSFAHQCHGRLKKKNLRPVESWKLHEKYEGRYGLGDDYLTDPVGSIKRVRGRDIAVMKLERSLYMSEAPFSLVTLEGTEEELQTMPPTNIYGYVCEKKLGHVVQHGDGRQLKYPDTNTWIRGHTASCTQSQHRYAPKSFDIVPNAPYALQFRGEFNTGHSGAVGFIECGDKKLGVGVLSGPNLSKDKYNENDVYVDSLLTGFSPPVIKWLRQALPETAMPPTEDLHVTDLACMVKASNMRKEEEECSQQAVTRIKEDKMWETTKLNSGSTLRRKRKRSTQTSPKIHWGTKDDGTPKVGSKRCLQFDSAKMPPQKKQKLFQDTDNNARFEEVNL